MEQSYDQFSEDEKLRVENDFLKMKMMLERGAQFGSMQNGMELPPELENEFLKNIIAFEEQHENREKITVFERIGKPADFKPAAEINDEEIDAALLRVNDLLGSNGINLDCCSPNISKRELYRFTLEELFQCKVDKIVLPGWICCFIYDEFHADPLYENTTAAIEACMDIFRKDKMLWTPHFRLRDLRLNDHYPLTENMLKDIVNRFKDAYEAIEIIDITDKECSVIENESTVKGIYKIALTASQKVVVVDGNWSMQFEKNADFGYWYIKEVEIPGIEF